MSKPANHSTFSTSWKSARAGSKVPQIRSDKRKVMPAVHSATLRAFCATTSSSPRIRRMKPAPASGRKITRERSGQSLIARLPSQPEQVPGDQGGNPDQHGEGVVVEEAGLQADRAPGDGERARRDAVGPEVVDHPDVDRLPEADAQA